MNNNNFAKIGTGRMYCDMPDWINQYEDEFQSDCSRLIYSPSFRRLQGKTQLYPNNEYDYFRSRLTHSLEVNEIAQCIRTRINQQIESKKKDKDDGFSVSSDVLRFACFAHDLGHPPFGHDGERELDRCMRNAGGFNGNSQTFRLLTRIEKGCINSTKEAFFDGERKGLNITFRSLASVLKNIEKTEKEKRGYYDSEEEIVDRIYKALDSSEYKCTLEAQIMDIADDISNAVHDLDDSLKGNLLNPFDLFLPQADVLEKLAQEVFHKAEDGFDYKKDEELKKEDFKKIYTQLNLIFEESGFVNFSIPKGEDIVAAISPIYKKMRTLSSDGAKRTLFIYNLKNKFIESLNIDYNDKSPLFSKIYFGDNPANGDNPELQIKILKIFHFNHQCKSFYIDSRAYRGEYIVKRLFYAIIRRPRLMPDDYYAWYKSFDSSEPDETKRKVHQKRCVCDFISGMTDRYCLEFYGRLYSENPQSIFKPL